MFIDLLELETSKLAGAVSVMQTLEKIPADERGELGWGLPYALLRITSSCVAILELAAAIAKAGYRECDRATLEEIKRETRDVLCRVSVPKDAA